MPHRKPPEMGKTAPIHDHIKGRKNELEFINGLVAKKGKETGIPTPCNDAVAEIARQINKEQLKMDRSNLELLKEKLAAVLRKKWIPPK